MDAIRRKLDSEGLASVFSEWGQLSVGPDPDFVGGQAAAPGCDAPLLRLFSNPPVVECPKIQQLMEMFWPGPLWLYQPDSASVVQAASDPTRLVRLAWACPHDPPFRKLIEGFSRPLFAKLVDTSKQRLAPTVLSRSSGWWSCHRVGFIRKAELKAHLQEELILVGATEPTFWQPTVPGLWLTGSTLQSFSRLPALQLTYGPKLCLCMNRSSQAQMPQGLSTLRLWAFEDDGYESELLRQLTSIRAESQQLGASLLVVLAPTLPFIPEGFALIRTGAPENSI